MKCVYCEGELEQLLDGDEWVTSDGSIFCSVTDEIHTRQLVAEDSEICLMCNEIKDNNGLIVCSECNKPERTINDIKRELEESV